MNVLRNSVAAAVVAWVGFAASPVHAETVNLPASAALANAGSASPNCVFVEEPVGFQSGNFPGGACDLVFPLQVPVGHTIQQIEVVYGSPNNAVYPAMSAHLGTYDFNSYAADTRFPWSGNLMPGAMYTTRLMQQTKFTYPDAFVVQQNTQYQVFMHVELGAYVTGLRITYQ